MIYDDFIEDLSDFVEAKIPGSEVGFVPYASVKLNLSQSMCQSLSSKPLEEKIADPSKHARPRKIQSQARANATNHRTTQRLAAQMRYSSIIQQADHFQSFNPARRHLRDDLDAENDAIHKAAWNHERGLMSAKVYANKILELRMKKNHKV